MSDDDRALLDAMIAEHMRTHDACSWLDIMIMREAIASVAIEHAEG